MLWCCAVSGLLLCAVLCSTCYMMCYTVSDISDMHLFAVLYPTYTIVCYTLSHRLQCDVLCPTAMCWTVSLLLLPCAVLCSLPCAVLCHTNKCWTVSLLLLPSAVLCHSTKCCTESLLRRIGDVLYCVPPAYSCSTKPPTC